MTQSANSSTSTTMGCVASATEFHTDPRTDHITLDTSTDTRLPHKNTKPQPLSTLLIPQFPKSFYMEQTDAYFDSLDTSKKKGRPRYSPTIARWEWPPWLILTAFKRENIHIIDGAIREAGPCICVNRNHKYFEQNPFIRSVITFYYGKNDIEKKNNSLQIYEEFTFNDYGEITFIEAWYDHPYLDLLPELDPEGWPINQNDIKRLSPQIPGLGNPDGLIDIYSDEMISVANTNQIVADFCLRAKSFDAAVLSTLIQQLIQNKTSSRPSHIPL